MKKNNIIAMVLLFVVTLLSASMVPAYDAEDTINDGADLPVQVLQVKVDGNVVENGDTITTKVERGDDLEVKVQLFSEEDVDDVEVEIFLKGDDHNTISETTDVFDVAGNEISWETLRVELPDNMEQDLYDLRVLVASRYGQAKIFNYNLRITTAKHDLEIRDVVLSPQFGVKAGQGLFGTVRLKNTGLKDQEGIKVTVSIPALGMSASDYIDELEAEDQITSEELWLGRVPECAEEGEYTVEVDVLFDEYSRSVSTTETLRVFEGDLCEADVKDVVEEKETIQVPTSAQDVQAGNAGIVYAMVLNNPSDSAKAFTISISGVEGWGTARVDPANTIIVDAKDSEVVSIFVSANEDATAGVRTFVAKVETSDSSADVVLTANVSESDKEPEQNGDDDKEDDGKLVESLQIALLVLVVLLVILGLILIFNKMRGKEEGNLDESSQSYY